MKRNPIYGGISQGRITEINGDFAVYYNADAFDGFGGSFEASLSDPMVEARP